MLVQVAKHNQTYKDEYLGKDDKDVWLDDCPEELVHLRYTAATFKDAFHYSDDRMAIARALAQVYAYCVIRRTTRFSCDVNYYSNPKHFIFDAMPNVRCLRYTGYFSATYQDMHDNLTAEWLEQVVTYPNQGSHTRTEDETLRDIDRVTRILGLMSTSPIFH